MYKFNILIACYCISIIAVFADEQTSYNKFCEINNKKFSITYNFSNLNPDHDTLITRDYLNETIKIRLCSSLKSLCNGKDGYGICLIKNKEEKGLGKMPPKVTSEPGKISFQFIGDDCMPGTKYVVNVIMKCDYLATNNTHPELFSHTDEQCILFMIWRTALACRQPASVTNCTVTHNGLHYDLSPLIRYSENYIIHTDTSLKIILNVCHSIIFEYGALCPMYSGACLQVEPEPPQFQYPNLGDVQKPPFIDNGQLKIRYEDGDMCKIKNTKGHISTTISFICDLEATDTIPEYIRGSEECQYQLIWKTAAACSVESLQNRSAITAGKCTVNNPLTNFTYNLQSLMNNDHPVTSQSDNQYKLQICGPLINTQCKSSTGVCLMKNGTSMGEANTKLMWQEGGPYLNYTNGDPCENGKKRYTIIAFVCGSEGSSTVPLVMEEYACQLIIHWYTDLVCEKRIKCATYDDEINLSALIKSSKNYVVKTDNNTEFHINICRPLVPTPGLTCAHGSAVCKTSVSSNNEFVNETSLGFPRENPILNKLQQAVLRYSDGSPCPENPNKMISSVFTFPCDYNNKGSPEYKRYEDCTYVFEWKTSVTCGAVMGSWRSPCVIRDQILSREYNLSSLYKNQQTYYVKNRDGKEYSINICGDDKYCNGSAVCRGANRFGSLANVIFDYSRDVVKLQYLNGSKCNNSSYTSEVQFICNESANVGKPELFWESQCSAEFEWYTNVTCHGEVIYSDKTTGTTDKDGSAQHFSPSHAGTVAGVVLTVIALIAAVIYFRNPNKSGCIRSCLNAFMSRRGGGRVQYCRVNTTEEARLLLDADPTQCQTDSDDDLLNA